MPTNETPSECVIELTPSSRLICPASPLSCDYVRVEVDGIEIKKWDAAQFEEAPEKTMGELLSFVRENLERENSNASSRRYDSLVVLHIRPDVELSYYFVPSQKLEGISDSIDDKFSEGCGEKRMSLNEGDATLISIKSKEEEVRWFFYEWKEDAADVLGAAMGMLNGCCEPLDNLKPASEPSSALDQPKA